MGADLTNKPGRNWLGVVRNLLFLGLGLLVLYQAFRGTDLGGVFENVMKANWYWIVIAKLIGVTAHWVRAARWKLIMAPMGYKPSTLNTLAAVLVGYFTNMAVPRMGEVMRCWSLKETDNLPTDKLIGTVVAERIVDVLALGGVVGLAFLVKYQMISKLLFDDLLGPKLEQYSNSMGLKGNTFLLGGLIIVALVALAAIGWWVLKKIGLLDKILGLAKNFLEGLRAIFQMERLLPFLGYTVLMWVIYFLGFYLCFFSLPESSDFTVADGIFVFALSGLSMIPPSQQGIGPFEYMVKIGLVALGMTATSALSLAVLIHGSSLLFMLGYGAIAMLYVLYLSRKKKAEQL